MLPVPKRSNITNERFGRLIAVQWTGRKTGGNYVWQCRCDCGTLKDVSTTNLRSGSVQSCGCFRRETLTKHGAKRRDQAHPLYYHWRDIIRRCFYKSYPRYTDYGGRGITMDPCWRGSYVIFRDYMLALPDCPKNAQTPGAILDRSIDRYPNNDGHYEPGNIRWATLVEQARNKRSNRFVPINGKQMLLVEAAEKYGKVSCVEIRKRLHRGWTFRQAFLTPLHGDKAQYT